MTQVLTEDQIDEALLLADAAMAAAGRTYHDPEHLEDLRETGRGRMSIDEVIRRGVERIRARG